MLLLKYDRQIESGCCFTRFFTTPQAPVHEAFNMKLLYLDLLMNLAELTKSKFEYKNINDQRYNFLVIRC